MPRPWRVLTGAGDALGGLERAEADQLHRIALRHGGLDSFYQSAEHGVGGYLRQVILGGQDFNELCAVHDVKVNEVL